MLCRQNSKEKWKITGIVSYGPLKCGHPKQTGVYANIPHYRKWIDDRIKNGRCCVRGVVFFKKVVMAKENLLRYVFGGLI